MTDLAIQPSAPTIYEGGALGTAALILQGDAFSRMERMAELMASGVATIPKHLQRNKADCFAVVMQSMQWGMNPIAVAQKTHLVSGVLGYESQLVNAVIISRAPVTGRLSFEWFGEWEKIVGRFEERESKTKKDDNGYPVKYRVPGWKIEDEKGLGVKVWATFKGEDTPRELTLLMAQARTRNSTLWADDPKQQLAYLATKRWSRLYCPDVIMGVYTPDELQEAPAEQDMGAAQVVSSRPAAPGADHTGGLLPDYTSEALNTDKAGMIKAVASGKLSVEGIVSKIRSRFTVSADMEKTIHTAISEGVKAKTQAEPAAAPAPAETTVSTEQIEEILANAADFAISDADLCKFFSITTLEQLPASKFDAALNFIQTGA